jgi:hypothetical protein
MLSVAKHPAYSRLCEEASNFPAPRHPEIAKHPTYSRLCSEAKQSPALIMLVQRSILHLFTSLQRSEAIPAIIIASSEAISFLNALVHVAFHYEPADPPLAVNLHRPDQL